MLETYTILLLEQFYKLPFTHKSYVRNILFKNKIDTVLILFYRILISVADRKAF